MHLAPLIRDLALILGVGGLVSLLFQRIKQPAILGYLVAGIAVGSYSRFGQGVQDFPNIQTWADIGVIFLMFSLGLEFSFRKLLKVGVSAAITAVIEVAAMLVLGYFVVRGLGWSPSSALFAAGVVAISSTTIILKSLEELKLKSNRFAQLIFGVLVVEDLLAIFLLVIFGNLAHGDEIRGMTLVLFAWRFFLVVGGWFIVGFFLIPRIMRSAGKKSGDETILLLSIGLCLCLAVMAAHFQYSVALGAFIMGSILAETTESARIEELIRPLRDVFGAVFFVSVGMLLKPEATLANLPTVLVLTAVVLIGKTLWITFASLATGRSFKMSVQIGMGMAQIGEFSFIIAGLAAVSGVGDPRLHSIAISVCMITSFTTPYFIRSSAAIATRLEAYLPRRVRNLIDHYAQWNVQRAANRERQAQFSRVFFRWVINGLVVSLVFVAVHEINMGSLHPLVRWILALMLSSPFLFAMSRIFKTREQFHALDAQSGGAASIVFRALTLVWLVLLSLEYVGMSWTVAGLLAVGSVLATVFITQLEAAYSWLEGKLLVSFQGTQSKSHRNSEPSHARLRHLAPWNAHLNRIKVHPNSEIAGKKISETELRSRYGLNIVAIQRGFKSIVAPHPAEAIYPQDEILVLGTDEQVGKAKQSIEAPPGASDERPEPVEYDLKNIEVTERSPMIGHSLSALALREKFGTVVVGIERGEARILNPDPREPLHSGDVLWLVSDGTRAALLRTQFDPPS